MAARRFNSRTMRYYHDIMVFDTFYENVEGPDGNNQVIQFMPRDRETMPVAWLWRTGRIRPARNRI
jgi:hypothetical protein